MANGGRVVVTISTRDETRAGVKRASRNVEGLTANINKLKVAGVAAFTAIAVTVTKAVSAFATFDTSIREITTLLSDVDENTVQQLEENILSLAVSTGQAVEDMAKANYDAISAGFADAGESAILLNQSARLAVGGVSDVAKTTDVLTTIVNSYGESAQAAAKFSDELFTIVRLGKTTVDELASGLGRAAAIAPQLGVSFQDLGAAVATLTAAGQSTDETITSLTNVLSKFLKPSEALKTKLNELGFATGKAAIENLGFAGALEKIAEGATEVELAEFFADIRAIRAVLPLAGTQAEKFAENVIEMGNAAGAADEAFRKVSEGIGARFEQINTLLQTALIAAGDAFLPLIEAMIGIDGELGNIAKRREELISFFEDVGAVVQGFVDVMTFLREISQEPLI
ncbi:MAG: phage tail tape measure protein, partial [Planctomycetota bacterium]